MPRVTLTHNEVLQALKEAVMKETSFVLGSDIPDDQCWFEIETTDHGDDTQDHKIEFIADFT